MRHPIPARTRQAQRQASDPGANVFVSANAGAGKTHVLAQRVVRIMLEGAAPAKILCLTFTKAAAANMAARVSSLLARWAMLDDEDLSAAIVATGASVPDNLDFARQLFAHALDTPGGLKIQTIHAFCERLLHVFPFEANVPVDFETLDDLRRLELLEEARKYALNEAAPQTIATLASLLWEGAFATVLDECAQILRENDDIAVLQANLKRALRLGPQSDIDALSREMIAGGLGPKRWLAIADLLEGGAKTDTNGAAKLRAAAAKAPAPDCLEDYLSFFFTEKGTIREKLITKAVLKIAPGLDEDLREEAERLQALIDKRKRVEIFVNTCAVMEVASIAQHRYQRRKERLGRLDFDDLIEKTRALLKNSDAAAWALYKLDGGLDHILIDESQDTSPAQWDIVRALAEEFFAGRGAQRQARAIFSVGDEKQSIFSFQGARPQEFAAMRRYFESRARAARKDFRHIRLDLSFRSAPEILRATDLVFASPQARAGLSAEDEPAPRHEALKSDVGGLVEIWPPLIAQSADPPQDWTAPLDAPAPDDPQNILARRIAAQIKTMIAPGAREAVVDDASGLLRAIAPGDVMILVRRRNAFFNAMIRALKEANLPVAGADRLDVGGHLATQDLIAAIKTVLTPQDDLTLACVLKSPLIGLDDEDLIALAPGREKSLWEALQNSAAPSHQAAARMIEIWRIRAKTARPFDFLSDILALDGGRRAFLERLGPEAADAIDELLRLARGEGREEPLSLSAFAHAIEHLELSVRRDLEAAGEQIRVMTVHAAKGLEAKIVFLPDTCAGPDASFDQTMFALGPPEARAYAFSPRAACDCEEIAQARENAKEKAREEYRRLLYVAMTRAEERLYVSGYAGVRGPQPGCWLDLIRQGLEGAACEAPSPFESHEKILRFGAPAMRDDCAQQSLAPVRLAAPSWLFAPAAPEAPAPPPQRPVTDLAAADALDLFAPSADNEGWRQQGILAHELLRILPETPQGEREVLGRRLAENFDATTAPLREKILRDVLRTIAEPQLATFFSTDSRAEVAFSATAPDGAPDETGGAIDIVGRIDRLVVRENEILIADFKTGAPFAQPAAIRQMALYRAALQQMYPERTVRAFLIFTRTQTAKELEPAALEAALRHRA